MTGASSLKRSPASAADAVKSLRAAASYAKALFALAKERNVTDRIGADLDGLVAALDSAPDAMALLSRPWLGAATRRAAALEVGTRSGVSPLARDFLALVAARGRIAELSAIAAAYRDLVGADAGRARVRVRAVVRLTEDERGRARRGDRPAPARRIRRRGRESGPRREPERAARAAQGTADVGVSHLEECARRWCP
ncbi:MAG: hypothetical protein DMD81_25110 [Candidatus Rokuibacteriota bacterium]|nr:MAG: hypothetical protein DMD81_25110 [Candidatus Rokubacteria bacterium]